MQLRALELATSTVAARLPFRFGRSTLRSAPLLTARAVLARRDGGEAVGRSADLLVPKWFDKDPATSDEEDRAALIASARAAGDAWSEAPPGTAFEQWLAVYRARVESVPLAARDRLVRGFGVALVERAVIDAACRAAGESFFDALRRGTLGIRPGEALAELAAFDATSPFAEPPAASIRVRHTVGLADALRASEVPGDLRGVDGHPCSLEEDVRAYGLDAFKVKVGGDPDADLARLAAVGRAIAELTPGAVVTLDGNEQYAEPGKLADVLARLATREGGAELLAGLAHVEQPAPRATTFDPAAKPGLAALAAFAPVIIDEADTGLDAFPRAYELGYRGVSVKNCKGVFRAILNRGLCERFGGGAFLAGEDLTNLPLLPLQQDLATAAALHLPHVERNGHHYFRGLDHLTADERAYALRSHGDLYVRRPASELAAAGVTLAIEGGRVRVASLGCIGYAHALP